MRSESVTSKLNPSLFRKIFYFEERSLTRKTSLLCFQFDNSPSTSLVERQRPTVHIDRLSNSALASGDFLESIIWDSGTRFKNFNELILDMNDPEMMLEVSDAAEGKLSMSFYPFARLFRLLFFF